VHPAGPISEDEDDKTMGISVLFKCPVPMQKSLCDEKNMNKFLKIHDSFFSRVSKREYFGSASMKSILTYI